MAAMAAMALRCSVTALPASLPRVVRRISSRAREVKDWVDGVVLQHGFCRWARRFGKRWVAFSEIGIPWGAFLKEKWKV